MHDHDSRKIRLENFSDAVMAIAITLLAFQTDIPHFPETVPSAGLYGIGQGWGYGASVVWSDALVLLPGILTFLLSFMTIAIFWVNHHQLTQHISMIKRRITWATMFFLFFMTLIPFASRLLFENGRSVFGIILYASVLFGGSVFFSVLHFLVHKKGELSCVAKLRSFVGPILYLFAIVVAPYSLFAAYVALIASPVFYFLPKKHAPVAAKAPLA